MTGMGLPGGAHRRRDLLIGDGVLVSPHQTPVRGRAAEETPAATSLTRDPSCYLCPGNPRAGGQVTPDYPDTFVFQVLVLDSTVSRSLAWSAYDERRGQCESAVRTMQQAGLEVTSLRDATPSMLPGLASLLPEVEYRRVRPVGVRERSGAACPRGRRSLRRGQAGSTHDGLPSQPQRRPPGEWP